MQYKDDVYLSGHVHTYERSYPVFDWDVRLDLENATSPVLVYDDPQAPVHIVNGAGGNIEVSFIRSRYSDRERYGLHGDAPSCG